jgi:DNA modification methylase
LAKAVVNPISNLRFAPEVSVGAIKSDSPVLLPWLANIRNIANDVRNLRSSAKTPAQVYQADARQISKVLQPSSVDVVITSPPYPNEKDYTRMTRLESVLLGFIPDKAELRLLKKNLVRSNTRNVYFDDTDDNWVEGYTHIQEIANTIEAKRVELSKTSGFERLYSRTTKLYFGGMLRHLSSLRKVLKPGARLAYVVGDQASYLQVMIQTGQLLAEIAESLGYEVTAIDLFRTRIATATRQNLREEVILLRWRG